MQPVSNVSGLLASTIQSQPFQTAFRSGPVYFGQASQEAKSTEKPVGRNRLFPIIVYAGSLLLGLVAGGGLLRAKADTTPDRTAPVATVNMSDQLPKMTIEGTARLSKDGKYVVLKNTETGNFHVLMPRSNDEVTKIRLNLIRDLLKTDKQLRLKAVGIRARGLVPGEGQYFLIDEVQLLPKPR